MSHREHRLPAALLAGLGWCLVLAAGCGQPAAPPADGTAGPPPPADSKSVSAKDVKQEVGEAAEALQQFAGQKKEDYVSKLDKQLQELDDSIARMKEQGSELSAEAKEKWRQSLEELQQQRQQYQEKYDKLRETSGEAWKEMAQGVSQAWSELKRATDEAAAQFGDQPAP